MTLFDSAKYIFSIDYIRLPVQTISKWVVSIRQDIVEYATKRENINWEALELKNW